jgi:hypothetical protein
MKEDLIADLWTVIVEHISEKHRKDVAGDYINTLLDHGVKETVIQDLVGIDTYLDHAIEYVLDNNNAVDDDVDNEDFDDEFED